MARWWWRADYFESCNCAHGCPCNFTALPTNGDCQAVVAWRIEEGACDGVRLDGCAVGMISRWPGAIHHGGGRSVVFIDERANEPQRDALARIATGQAGEGGPFVIFAATFAAPPRTVVGPLVIDDRGDTASVRLGELGEVAVAPIRSAMDGNAADARLVLPTGFIFRDARMMNTERCVARAPEVAFSHAGSSAFLSRVAYNV